MKFSAKTIKIAVVVFVLGAGIISSYLIVANSGSKQNSGGKADAEEIKSQLTANPIKWVENNAISGIVAGNFTDNFTENLKESIIRGIKSSDSKSVEKEVNDIITNEQKIDLISNINAAELKISNDNSKEAKKKYLETIGEISKTDIGDFKENYSEIILSVFKNLDVSLVKKASIIHKNLSADYLKISAPSDWIEFHKGLIINFRNSEIVYSAMAEYLEDPIKGYLGMNALGDIIKESRRLEGILYKNIKEIQ